MPRARKPFTVETRKSRRSRSADEKRSTIEKKPVETPKSRAPGKRHQAVEQVEETAEQRALKEKVDAAARSGRILAERSDPEEAKRREDVQSDPVEHGDKQMRQPSRRYRKKQPVRSIDLAEYEDRTEAPASVPKSRVTEPAAKTKKPARIQPMTTDQPDDAAPAIRYRIRRAWRTGGVALGDRWKVRSDARRHRNRRGKASD